MVIVYDCVVIVYNDCVVIVYNDCVVIVYNDRLIIIPMYTYNNRARLMTVSTPQCYTQYPIRVLPTVHSVLHYRALLSFACCLT